MGKRYVYWRTPTGKPDRTREHKHALREVLSQVGKGATVAPDGIQWQGFGIIRFETALKSAILVQTPDGDELNDRDCWGIIRKAIIGVVTRSGGGKPISPEELVSEADRHAAEFFRNAAAEYVLVTSLSVKSLPTPRIVLPDAVVSQLKNRRTHFVVPPILGSPQHHVRVTDHISRTRYSWVAIQTTGRTFDDAVEKSLTNLALLRGLWTLFSTYGSWSIDSGSTARKFIGVIHVGPVHTLHYPNGATVDDQFWYEPEYTTDTKVFDPPKGWANIERNRKWAMKRIRDLPYRRDICDLISRYATALDQSSHSIAFLHLWNILEKVTDTVGANYDETIRRAVWFYDDKALAADMIEAIRLRRNRLVHAARSGDDPAQVAYMAKSFVEPHLIRLVRNDFKVDTLEDYGRFLSLPTSLDALEKQHRRYGLAAKLVRVSSRPSTSSA